MRLTKILLQFEQQVLAALLLLLHTMTWTVDDSRLQVALTFVLYGLFLLWQPLWNKKASIDSVYTFIPLILLAAFSFYYPNESLILFSLIMVGLIGSRLFSYTAYRSFDLLALSILIIEAAIGIIPLTFKQISLPAQFAQYIQAIVLVPIIVLFFAPVAERGQQTRSQIDLMHGVLTASVIFIVLLSGIVINILYGVDYIDGLLLSVFLVSTLAIGISWFWNPGVGYSGLGVLWNRYTMTIGGPFEIWINTLTTLIEEPYISANEFLQSACDNLVENEWLNGIQWQFDNFSITSGAKQGALFEHPLSPSVCVSIFFKSDPGQALRQHTILLVRMAYQFYLAKQNQEKMRAEAYFETIHHTGARLTHDIKNILQSIKASLDIVDLKPDKNSSLPSRLLSQNLNQISQRLEATLSKLKEPELSTSIRLSDIRSWYEDFTREHSKKQIMYRPDIQVNHAIPSDLFDSVVSNLIANALEKKDASTINVDVICNSEMIMITVCDNGANIEPDVESQLFNKPVSSGQGMGIGLYQSAIMARTFSYELELTSNLPGKVCFSLFQHRGE